MQDRINNNFSFSIVGFINTLLSWKGIIPLSRLTYCAYLVHIVVMDTYFLSKRSLVYLTDLEEVSMQILRILSPLRPMAFFIKLHTIKYLAYVEQSSVTCINWKEYWKFFL